MPYEKIKATHPDFSFPTLPDPDAGLSGSPLGGGGSPPPKGVPALQDSPGEPTGLTTPCVAGGSSRLWGPGRRGEGHV